MKKYLLGLWAVIAAIALSSYNAPTRSMVSFHFIPANGAEIYYESAIRWEEAAFSWECMDMNADCCILRIEEDRLYYYSGTPTQQLAAYLADQGFGSNDYINATDAVISLTYTTKP
ncbi:hypothetical protein [Chitinophaga niabensis]|uniref:Uncharacterized protein n=1 Tax=Chitinophaga niabensis TaxID=536979 RepID=A0A1N6JZ24_9BACT|nr:hypothetical protein [Chitinophaga niabensis]SIO49377.1 hypothetical protein SAMN04488055_4702 [Chitinophaga niabensis]